MSIRCVSNAVRHYWLLFLALSLTAVAQDASAGAIRGTVSDSSGGRIAMAQLVTVNIATGFHYAGVTNNEGGFAFELLRPGEYSVRASAAGMGAEVRTGLTSGSGWRDRTAISPACRWR